MCELADRPVSDKEPYKALLAASCEEIMDSLNDQHGDIIVSITWLESAG